ncbi:hypothetical protein DFH08DRAFT_820552 [Mycena albidolilacea]|uniref:Uncharacterized protein n=1 Tax=Mycena albidolilacea TaxID=1033008 RepID=A0AAD7EE52_9AGAR|nr:hypothetical protein DFH08DRAFT_820552 [Mycena albidolilacea]
MPFFFLSGRGLERPPPKLYSCIHSGLERTRRWKAYPVSFPVFHLVIGRFLLYRMRPTSDSPKTRKNKEGTRIEKSSNLECRRHMRPPTVSREFATDGHECKVSFCRSYGAGAQRRRTFVLTRAVDLPAHPIDFDNSGCHGGSIAVSLVAGALFCLRIRLPLRPCTPPRDRCPTSAAESAAAENQVALAWRCKALEPQVSTLRERLSERFGELPLDFVCCNSLPPYFATRIHKPIQPLRLSAFGIYAILLLAVVQIVAGIIQTIWSCNGYLYTQHPTAPRHTRCELRSILKLDDMKAIHTLQSTASHACDLITTYLCLFLKHQKGEMMRTNTVIDILIRDAINRSVLTALSSVVNGFVSGAPLTRSGFSSDSPKLSMLTRVEKEKVFSCVRSPVADDAWQPGSIPTYLRFLFRIA